MGKNLGPEHVVAAMPASADLTAALANALGVPRGLAEETARHLREAKMLPDGEDQATVEHAVTLLLGLMAAPAPADAPDVVRLYRQLPLDRVTRGELTPDGRTEMVDITDPEPLMGRLRQGGETFGEFFRSLIEADDTGSTIKLGAISVGGGPGTAQGVVQIVVDDPAHEPVVGFVSFTLAPLGGGRHPDDAPHARLDVYATVPGSIFTVLRELFLGHSEGPQKTLPSRTAAAHQAGQSR